MPRRADPSTRVEALKSLRSFHDRLRIYGLTLSEYIAVYKRQQGRCAICEKDRELVFDHDHKTGRFRGLLCRPCNVAIGQLGDSVEGLGWASIYLLIAAEDGRDMDTVPTVEEKAA